MPQQAFSPTYRPQRRGSHPPLGSSRFYFADGTKIPGARIDGSVRAATMMGGDEGPLSTRGQFWGNPNFRPAASLPEQQPKGRWVPGVSPGAQVFIPEGKNDPLGRKEFNPPPAPEPAKGFGAPATAPFAPASTPAKQPEIMGPPKPAKFMGEDGKWQDRATWFGAAAKRQGQSNAYSGEALAQAQTAKPAASPATPAAKSAAPAAVVVTPKPAPTPTSQTPAGVPKPTFDNPDHVNNYNKGMAALSPEAAKPAPAATPSTSPAPSTSNASWFSNAAQGLVQGAKTMMADRAADEKRLADAKQRAKPGMVRVGESVAQGAKAVGGAVKAGAQAVNEGVPKAASAIATGAENMAKSAVDKAKEVTAPVRTWVHGDQSAAAEAAKLEAKLNPTPAKPYVPTYTGGDNPPMPAAALGSEDDKKKKQVATK